MKRTMFRLALALLLVGAGWAAGRAQTAGPDFELLVDAPEGTTTVECVRGCNLKWVQRGDVATAATTPRFEYACARTARCSSGKVGGWIVK